MAKRCIANLQSDCYLHERLRLSAFQYVADYICTDIHQGNADVFGELSFVIPKMGTVLAIQ